METKRLRLAELEMWKAKAAALDEAIAYLQGRMDNEKLIKVNRILHGWMKADGSTRGVQ